MAHHLTFKRHIRSAAVCSWLFACVLSSVLLPPTVSMAQGLPKGVAPGNRALVIGIDKYENPNFNLSPNSSVKDARDIAQLAVEKMGFRREEIVELINEKATRKNILHAIDKWLIAESRPGSRLLLQYSGHGGQIPDKNDDEEDKLDEVIVPYDAQMPQNAYKNLILDDELDARFSKIKDRDVVIILDSCHSGSSTRNLLLSDENDDSKRFVKFAFDVTDGDLTDNEEVTKIINEDNTRAPVTNQRNGFFTRTDRVQVWSAVAENEVALVNRRATPNQGVFTRSLIEALSGKADFNGNGIISNQEVLEYIRHSSKIYCNSANDCAQRGRTLSPTFEGSADAMARDFRTGRTSPNVASAVTDALGQGASGNTAQPTTAGQPEAPRHPLKLSILPGNNVKIGQDVTFEIASTSNGHLVLLDINAAGIVTQIFPNKFSQATGNFIAAGRPIRLPEVNYGFAFEADAPAGRGTLVAIVSSQSVDLSDLAPPSRGFKPVERPVAVVGDIVQRLNRELELRMKQRDVQWSYATHAYEIHP